MTPKQWHRYLIRKTAEYIKAHSIQGAFVECGVKQGSSSVIMAEVLQRRGFLFDTWKGFPAFSDIDAFNDNRKKQLERRVYTAKDTYMDCIYNLRKKKVFHYCRLIRGDICSTIPNFASSYNDKICLLHIDTDLYVPAKISLTHLWDKVETGGIVFFHDYGDKTWPGIKQLVDQFTQKHNISFHVFDPDKLFSCFLVKGISDIRDYESYIK